MCVCVSLYLYLHVSVQTAVEELVAHVYPKVLLLTRAKRYDDVDERECCNLYYFFSRKT